MLDWLDRYDSALLFTTSVTIAEIRYGLEILPDGKRKTALAKAMETFWPRYFEGRVLPFDEAAAIAYAGIAAARRKAGKPISHFDAMIAAIAKAHSFAIATRDERGYEGCGVRIVNPWRA